MKTLYKYLCALVVLLVPMFGSAASVGLSVSPTLTTVNLNQTFTLDIVGDYDADVSELLVGGAINLSVSEPSVLRINSVVVPAALPQEFGSTSGTINGAASEVDTIGFATFVGVTEGPFTLARVEFEAIGLGTSLVSMVDANDALYVWARQGGLTVPFSAVDGSVTVVPIPAAAYLLATGLVGLVGVSRRRKLK